MSQITGGTIVYGRTIQPAQYESKKAECTLTFVVGEGEDFSEMAKVAEDFAITKVHEMVGIVAVALKAPKAVVADKPAAVDTAAADAAKAAHAAKEAAKVTPPATTKTKRPPAAAAPTQAISTGEERVDPAAIVEDDISDVGTSDDDILGTVETVVLPPKVITDQDLTSAITRVNQKLQNAPALRALVAKFVAPPKGSRDIPQDQRQKFVDELEAMIK